MSEDHISVSVGGDVRGQFAVGRDIAQTNVTGGGLTAEQRAELTALFDDLRARLRTEAPPELQSSATERIGELEAALTAETPDLTTIQSVKRWFARNVPRIAGAVTAVLVHPLVGTLVQAGGDAIAGELDRIAHE